ncbi:MAG: c-type cytochrome [Vicinamibacterales bacterium]
MKSRNSHLLTVFVATLVALAAGTIAGAGQEAAKTVNDGVFSTDQAGRGQKAFESRCTTCHEPSRFIGPDFVKQWSGQPLHALYDVMQSTMPEDNPGSLQPQQYADIVAFILQLNNFPVGSEELKGTEEAMKAVKMEPLKSAGAR